jgi:histidinol dehydrogenase
VLPTYGFARRYSSLGVSDFVRTMTVQEVSDEGLRTIGPIAATLAELEGLDAHARAVTQRLAVLDAAGAAERTGTRR